MYTSGSTGNPKGVLHEWGNFDRICARIRDDAGNPFAQKNRVALLSPLNFVASVIMIVKKLSVFGARLYVVSYATLKNPGSLVRFFRDQQIRETFLTPSYARKIGSRIGPYLKTLFLGSEPANNIFIENVNLFNAYAASETGGVTCVFRIDRPYEVCPVGKPEEEGSVILLDEDGQPVPDGETGEVCFRSDFTRGYIHLPEENRKAFVNGFFRSGDLACKNENGDLVLLGRKDDMIKINGNRIEPAEIESAVMQALDIDWAAARGFEVNNRSFLCVYYTADISFNAAELRKKLLRRLPYYMIPSCYMKIDAVPLRPNGKLDRRALPMPDAESYHNDYAAPQNDTERELCRAMAKTLHLNRVGIHDDFYEMGGDSLASMEMITESGLPGLNAGDIFRGRTPEQIARIYLERMAEKRDEEKLLAASLKKTHPLTAEQTYMLDYQLYTSASTMYNLFVMFRVDKEKYDLQRLADALGTVIRHHPALLTVYSYNEDWTPVQHYAPEIFEEIRVERLTEFEMRFVKDMLVYPYKIMGGKLCRCRVFETEEAGYVFFDVHHSLFDGTSMKVFWTDVMKAYRGEALDQDYYYLMLARREQEERSAFYEESRQYFEHRFENVEWSGFPKFDFDSRKNQIAEIKKPLDVADAQLRAAEQAFRVSRNEFLVAVGALTISIYNDLPDVRLSWIYNGREDTKMMSSLGLLFRALPVGIRFRDDETLRNVLTDVHEQVQGGITHSCYPYVDIHNQVARYEPAYLLYQQDLRDAEIDGFEVEPMDIRWNDAAAQAILDMEILDDENGLSMLFSFTSNRYAEFSMERFMTLFSRVARIMSSCHSQADVTIGEIRTKLVREEEN